MTNDNNKHAQYTKTAWKIYALMAAALAVVLILLIAQDTEEQLFYGIMTIAVAYVFRPTDRVINKYVLKYTGVSPPTENE